MSAQAERAGIVDVHTLARLFQAAQVTRHKDTVHADVVNDLVLCRFLLGQMFGHMLNQPARLLPADVAGERAALPDRARLSRG